MEYGVPSCSHNKKEEQSYELAELSLESGINVWGTDQQTLEKQALQEFDIFTKESNLEDGEIFEEEQNINDKNVHSLNIENYIKRQEELRKIQEYKKTLQVNNNNNTPEKKQKRAKKRKRSTGKSNHKKVEPEHALEEPCHASGSDYVPSDNATDSEWEENPSQSKDYTKKKLCRIGSLAKLADDGCLMYFKARLDKYYKQLEIENCVEDEDPEHLDYYTIKGGLKIPFKIWNKLFSYQQDGVRWLWNIHVKSTGGILGDEMGLGKTVEVIAFLAALEYSQVVSGHDRFKGVGPTIIVCPVTVIHQWLQHFHEWAAEFRVAILHNTGSYQGNKVGLIKEINKSNGILITNYTSILQYKEHLLEYNWHYLILDEGHKIRNPTAKVTVAVKNIRTPHRLLLSGSPMQNNLQELWSLFDFTNHGMLGNISTFMEHFNNPIVQGGFVNSTSIQEATALSVATTLKNVITPFLLRRLKSEVQEHINLPNKCEQVLFCSLTRKQTDLYKQYLTSGQVEVILGRDSKNWFSDKHTRSRVLIAITALRKICNHPDIYLFQEDESEKNEESNVPIEDKFGYYKKSGKMVVVSALLKIWRKQKHRVLLFTQSRAMIVIFEQFLTEEQYKYLKMDGSTAAASRQSLINKFNEDCSYDVFLLTTRVGGLGVNLTGANRVIIYDPDWNPATDTQAKERAWRIGQVKDVTIYRLLSAGTIEEKMYQRQVWKQLLSNKVLLDPKTQKFFKSSSLYDLLSLQEDAQDANPETANIFRDSRVRLQKQMKKKRKKTSKDSFKFSDDKIEAMKNLAQQIAKSISKPGQIVEKSSYQLELEEERQKKLEEKLELKQLTPLELLQLNRERANRRPELQCNKFDDCDTNASFSSALENSEKASKLYTHLKKDLKISSKKHTDGGSQEKMNKKSKKEMYKTKIDNSGTIDGEQVDGLVKTETKKLHKKYKNVCESETKDQYILDKLFSRKGLSGVLQHDSVVGSGVSKQSLKVHTEAKLRADKALEALRKSRLDTWRW